MPRRCPSFSVPSYLLAAAVAGALLLAGCSSGGAPSGTTTTTATPTVSAPASPSESPSPVGSTTGAYKPADAKGRAENVPVPVMPAAARENTKEGLEAFIRYWYAVKSYANETGDVQTLRSLHTSECGVCTHMVELTLESYESGRWISGGKLSTGAFLIEGESLVPHSHARIQVMQDEIHYYNANGSEGRPSDAATNDVFLVIAAFEGEWKVTQSGVLR
ncbi:DUF6318 family protein [Paenarthrobacter sp. NCHU4564]|uniref:DUF6318 family protein n=1 Tax=Paenarthrobacter sp. NCHU4564 TaxID=3451353 RepID=UPI003F9AF3E4